MRWLALLALLLPALAGAVPVSGRITHLSDRSAYAVWIATSLDLTEPGQPALRIPVAADGTWSADWPAPETPHWFFVHQRFQHVDGPPVDLLLPFDLLPQTGAREAPVVVRGVDPDRLLDRQRFHGGKPLAKTLLAFAVVLGGGLLLRRLLRRWAAPEGRQCAPLELPRRRPVPRWEAIAVGGLLLLALVLRLRGLSSQSLDLLEASYLPGIGRVAGGGGASGWRALPYLLAELGTLYCLDLTHPPLWHAVEGFMGLFGRSEAWLRLPALVASLAACFGVYRLARRLGPAAGVAALAVFAVASPSVYFGQDATPYAFVAFVAVATVASLLRALESGRDRPWWWFFGLLVAGFLSHYNVALLGAAELAVLAGVVAWRRRDPRWLAALRRGLGPAVRLAPLPLLWLWPHWSTFEAMTENTRLIADTYAADPGLPAFLKDFTQVLLGVPADGPTWAAGAGLALAALGLAAARRRPVDAALGVGLAAGFVLSVIFFHSNVTDYLAGRVFFGFRWVAWGHPVLVLAAAAGAAVGPGPHALRVGLAALWMAGVVPATAAMWQAPSRPAYREAVRTILENLEDGDGLASLPAWFQRGNLSYYVFALSQPTRRPESGEGAWQLHGKTFVVEAIHPSLPFETTARNTHLRRLWVAEVDERMAGRAKFSRAVARQALDWAQTHLEPDGVWDFPRLRLHRFRLPPPPTDQPVTLVADRTVLHFRTYPLVRGPIDALTDAAELSLPPTLGPTPRFHAPTTPGCVDWSMPLPRALEPEAPNHWYLRLKIPSPQQARASVEAQGPGQVSQRQIGEHLEVAAVGGPCTGPPLAVTVRWGAQGAE